jgi:L-serine deaminase
MEDYTLSIKQEQDLEYHLQSVLDYMESCITGGMSDEDEPGSHLAAMQYLAQRIKEEVG